MKLGGLLTVYILMIALSGVVLFCEKILYCCRNATIPQNDVTKGLHGWCMYGIKQLPARLLYGAAVVGWGYFVARGYEKTFANQATVMPIASVVF